MKMTVAYKYFDQEPLYLNITNRCTNKCTFCIRYTKTGVKGEDLWLEHEPSVDEIKQALINMHYENAPEIVFCGYGEPTMRYDIIPQICQFIKNGSKAKIRINTNGHGNRIAGRDITGDFVGLIDEISISLNEKNAQKYNEICKCDYGEQGFYELLDFAKAAKKNNLNVVLSIVDVLSKEDIEECKRVANDTGIPLRIREYSE